MSELTFQELLYGSGAHANTLACVDDVLFVLAGRRVAARRALGIWPPEGGTDTW